VTRAAKKSTTSEWTSLSILRARGWGKQRIWDTLKTGQLPARWYPRGLRFDWHKPSLKLDCEENTASIRGDAFPPEIGGMGFDTVTISEIEILVPVDEPQPQATIKDVLPEAVERFPKAPDEPLYGEHGYAQRLQRSDPRLIEWEPQTIINTLYQLELL
jgi:hypothetical protein